MTEWLHHVYLVTQQASHLVHRNAVWGLKQNGRAWGSWRSRFCLSLLVHPAGQKYHKSARFKRWGIRLHSLKVKNTERVVNWAHLCILPQLLLSWLWTIYLTSHTQIRRESSHFSIPYCGTVVGTLLRWKRTSPQWSPSMGEISFPWGDFFFSQPWLCRDTHPVHICSSVTDCQGVGNLFNK